MTLIPFTANLNELGKHNRVYALDIPGDAGKSILRKQDGPVLIEDYNLMILEILDNLKLKDITLVGHSIGGFLATGFAISYPGRVKQLVSLSPVATHIDIRWYFRILLKMGGKPGKGPGAEKTLRVNSKILMYLLLTKLAIHPIWKILTSSI